MNDQHLRERPQVKFFCGLLVFLTCRTIPKTDMGNAQVGCEGMKVDLRRGRGVGEGGGGNRYLKALKRLLCRPVVTVL